MITLVCASLLLLVACQRDPLSSKRRAWRREADLGPALQRRWLRRN